MVAIGLRFTARIIKLQSPLIIHSTTVLAKIEKYVSESTSLFNPDGNLLKSRGVIIERKETKEELPLFCYLSRTIPE